MKPQPTPPHVLGRPWAIEEIAAIIQLTGCDYPVETLATIMAESGGWEWARPIVDKTGAVDQRAHLSTDRGVCQFNSFWWAHVSDREAYDPLLAVPIMCAAANNGLLGYWNAYGTANYDGWLPAARKAFRQ